MTAINANLSHLAERRDDVVSRLSELRRRVRLHLLVAGIARVFAEGVALAVLSLLVDRWLRLGRPLRIALLMLALTFIACEIWRFVIHPFFAHIALLDLAYELDRVSRHPERREESRPPQRSRLWRFFASLRLTVLRLTKRWRTSMTVDPQRLISTGFPIAPRVATVLELPTLLTSPLAPSPAMVERAVEHAHESLKNVNFTARIDHRRFTFQLSSIASLIIAILIFTMAAPATANLWVRRWFAGSNVPWPQKTYLTIAGLRSDGRIIVPRDEPFVLRTGVRPGSEAPDSISIRLRERQGPRVDGTMTKFAAADFRYDVPSVDQPIDVEVWGGDDDLGPFTIDPVDRPRITRLELISQHPTELKPTRHLFTGQETDLSFLPRTKLDLEFESNVSIAEATVRNANGPAPAVHRLDDRRFTCKWTQEQAMQLEIELTGTQAHLSSIPTPLSIGLKVDQPPRVTLAYTGVHQHITPIAHIPLTVSARDDYGVVHLDLADQAQFLDSDKKLATTATTKPIYGPIKPPKDTDVQIKQQFDVAPLKLPVGALLSLRGIAEDDCYLGPQKGASRPASFRIVSPEELFKEILLRQQSERAKFRKMIERAQKIRDDLRTVTEQSAPKIAHDHRTVQREVMRITTSLAESMTELRLNQLGSPEAYDLMEKNVIKPLGALNDQLLNPQRDALETLDAGDASKVADVANRQDKIVEKMKEILKQMSQWDSFVDVLNQLNEIIHMQEDAKSQTDDLRHKEVEGVFEK